MQKKSCIDFKVNYLQVNTETREQKSIYVTCFRNIIFIVDNFVLLDNLYNTNTTKILISYGPFSVRYIKFNISHLLSKTGILLYHYNDITKYCFLKQECIVS